MDILENKNVLLGVTGSIAAYKSAELVSILKKSKCNIKVCMTESSQAFITSNTLEALSANNVITSTNNTTSISNFTHIEEAKWADILVIAPCTANFINKLANGHGDDILSLICLAFDKKIYIAPAMNPKMWANKITQESLNRLTSNGVEVLGTDYGTHACGDIGYGRMMDPKMIIEKLTTSNNISHLVGKKILVTAGPTREPIDPVRFISNYSSGKMGIAVANAAVAMGANVELILGPSSEKVPDKINISRVETSQQMLNAVQNKISSSDIYISTAAISDYTPIDYSPTKYKKNKDSLEIKFRRGTDILKTISDLYPNIYCVGFAAETEQLVDNAKTKLNKKNLNMIVGNIANHDLGLGFESDFNEVIIITEDSLVKFPKEKKNELAFKIVELISDEYFKKASLQRKNA
tara:strand:+ start:1412 stop:2638 length:1227 start_codon:yes stop_codon:yes gene_type:complete